MKKINKLSMPNIFKSVFSPGSSGREAAIEWERNEAKKNTDIVFENIEDCLARGEIVRVAGFGSFGTRKRVTKMAKNPRTGEKIQVKAINVPFFKAGKELKEKVK